jgi:hypothetical protein
MRVPTPKRILLVPAYRLKREKVRRCWQSVIATYREQNPKGLSTPLAEYVASQIACGKVFTVVPLKPYNRSLDAL